MSHEVLKDAPELEITHDTVSVILMGGLGNMMFQVAALMSHAKDQELRPLVGYWSNHQSEFSKNWEMFGKYGRNGHFDPWGSHPMKNPPITLGDVFPKLPWFVGRPNAFDWWFDQSMAWEIDTGKGGVYIPLEEKLSPPGIVQGYFFNQKYWHHNRDYLLDIFTADPGLEKWMDKQYGMLFEKDTISVHLRIGSKMDFIEPIKVPGTWIVDKIKEIDDNSNILVFSDNLQEAREFFYKSRLPRGRTFFIDEDQYMCMLLMAKCDKHILTNSTLSFWGAYLDVKQENPYTFIHETFFESHPREMIPYESWQISS
jgi:hypothetical protein